jgi:hypothetical protein
MPNEICTICGKETDIDINTHIDLRYGYTEGAGQACRECYDRIHNIKPTYSDNDYITKVMKNRTTLITISAEDILNTPNDQELGAKVRQKYWETTGETPEPNQWVCSYCGGDTSEIDYDYLVNTNHLECVLKMNP